MDPIENIQTNYENNIVTKHRVAYTNFCEKCNFTAIKPSDWLRHIETEKHKRDGEKKMAKCDKCDIEYSSNWSLNQHYLIYHATKEEREKHKFYCKQCDVVFFSKIYMIRHMNGKVHKNLEKALNST